MRILYPHLYLLSFLYYLFYPSCAAAESQVFDFNDEAAEEILFQDIASVYSASKYEQKITEAPARISIVTAKEIQNYGYRTLADILNSLPGFYTTNDRNYAYTGARSFSLTGDFGTKFLQLVDGHRMNDNIYDGSYIDRSFIVDVDLIDRIEIVRGPSSSLYGSSAFFGVINIITKKGRDLQGFETSASVGSFNSYQGRLSYGKRFDNGFEMLTSFTYYDSDGDDRLYYQEFNDPTSNNGIAEDMDDENAKSFFTKLSFGDFLLEGGYIKREKGIPTASYETVFNDPRTRTWEEHSYLDLKYQHLLDNQTELTARLYIDDYQYDGDWSYDYSAAGDLSEIEIFKDMAEGRWWGTEIIATRSLFEDHKMTLGSEYRDTLHQQQKQWDTYEVYQNDKTDDYTWAVFIQDEYKIRDNLIFNLGVRYDYFDTVGSSTNPRAALIYSPFASTSIKLLYGTAFRAPNAYEQYYHDGNITQKAAGNLNSEGIDTYEFIVEQKLTSSIRLVTSIYHNEITDLIALTTDPSDGLLVFSNIDDAKATGTEIELEGRWLNGWEGSISYTYQYAENKSTGKRLINFPLNMLKGNIIIPLQADTLLLALEGQYESGRKTLDNATTNTIFLTNTTLRCTNLIPDVTVSASIYNLFDKGYANPSSEEHLQDSIEQDGRTFRLKLDYTF